MHFCREEPASELYSQPPMRRTGLPMSPWFAPCSASTLTVALYRRWRGAVVHNGFGGWPWQGIPGSTWVEVGGTLDRGEWNTDPDPSASVDIMKRANDMLPILQAQPGCVRRTWAGLRPCRTDGVCSRSTFGVVKQCPQHARGTQTPRP